ncbi:MAG: hypothetical protein IT210_21715, partial [Armatimonadetes bacterium]|nr:hypothetical protein [Armatimonadota bacterium]
MEEALQYYETDYELRETDPDLDGESQALEAIRQGAERLLACGGGSTVKGAINGICKSRKEEAGSPAATLGIVPGGTANLVARALGIPMKVSDTVAMALAGEKSLIDVGRCRDHSFALGIGVGMTKRLVSQASDEEKEKLSRWAYARAIIGELGARSHTFQITLDGDASHRRRGAAVVVANIGEIGGKLSFAPDARIDDSL